MNLPLRHCRILNTRAVHQAASLTNKLQSYGGIVEEVPLISMRKPTDMKPILTAIHDLNTYKWIVFTSANTVQFFFDLLENENISPDEFTSLKVAAVGTKTKEKLIEKGFHPDVVPRIFDGEHLANEIILSINKEQRTQMEQGSLRVLIPRSQLSRDVLPEKLKAANIDVDTPVAYETSFNLSNKSKLNELLIQDQLDLITFTSPSTVHSFFKQVKPEVVQTKLSSIHFAVIGGVTAEALKGYGIKEYIVPKSYTIENLISEIVKVLSK
ncbi:uroporphyrinogen-III synthase [Evansella sp. AB-P1]|uniref:uroporphyrinogen-III synthase n=1 Tax=Evansella sp. AB-P1 TaxID=3037653 RepID=UPI00241F89E2|nr:uroporphyrinogen-III synthase [Evansella sp. AB-P1]MDG5786889.1 uroporphyrinogen-III synthase [Evansella sp. AB-P1]